MLVRLLSPRPCHLLEMCVHICKCVCVYVCKSARSTWARVKASCVRVCVVAYNNTMHCRVEVAIGCTKQHSRVDVPTHLPVFGHPQSTLRARKTLCGQNVTNMVNCQMPTIACNLPLQAHTKLLSCLLALV